MLGQAGASSSPSSGSSAGAGNQGGAQGAPQRGGAPQQGGGQRGGQGPQHAGHSGAAMGGEGADFDFQGEFERTRQELGLTHQQMQRLNSELQTERSERNKQSQVLDRVRQAFVGDERGDDAGPDPVEALEAEMEQIIDQAYQADKEGRPIPLTTRANIRALQTAIQFEKFQKTVMEKLSKLDGATRQANDPQVAINRQAYGNMDSAVQRSLDQIYGMDDGQRQVKGFQFQAVTAQLKQVITQLQKERPEAWDVIRRDPRRQQQLVQHYVKQMLPPKAVAMLEQDHLENTPFELGELWQAFREAKGIQDPHERANTRELIRRQILQMTAGPKGQRSGR